MQSSFNIWNGTSPFDGKGISLILTGMDGSSVNPKTGQMIQSWIIPTQTNPVLAIKNGDDQSCCGSCPLRPAINNFIFKNSCYVARVAFRAPRSVWQYNIKKPLQLQQAKEQLLNNPLPIRYGAYGDIAMIPKDIFESIHACIKDKMRVTHTAYTHQHKYAWAYWVRRYAMASVENKCDARFFRALGWRTFRIGSNPEKNEIMCPNYTHNIQCIKCGLCDGNKSDSDKRKSIVIPKH